jgi:hypothetical protein
MGLLIWVLVAVLILSVIGLGWQTFVMGVFKGGEKIININPEIKNVTQKVQKYIVNIIKNASEGLINNNTITNQSSSAIIQPKQEGKEKIYTI